MDSSVPARRPVWLRVFVYSPCSIVAVFPPYSLLIALHVCSPPHTANANGTSAIAVGSDGPCRRTSCLPACLPACVFVLVCLSAWIGGQLLVALCPLCVCVCPLHMRKLSTLCSHSPTCNRLHTAKASKLRALAVGADAVSSGERAIAVGGADALDDNAIAIGGGGKG